MKLIALMLSLLPLAAQAQWPESGMRDKGRMAAHQTQLALPDVSVIDSHQREHQLQTLLQDRVAVVNFVFTSCTTVCPALSGTMQALQQQLQERLGKEVILVSVSVDPARDTPEKLSTHAAKLGAGSDWYWLTGKTAEINQLLKAFGIPVGRPEDHLPVILVGKVNTGHWLRWVGIPAPETLTDAVTALVHGDL